MSRLPADLPVLVGRQYVLKLHVTLAASLTAPTATAADVRRGIRLRPLVSVPSPTATTGLVKMISPNFHLDATAEVTPPGIAGESHVVGYRVSGSGVLPALEHPRASTHKGFLVLQTPSQAREFRFRPGSQMWGFWSEAMSLYRQYGEWQAGYVPVPDELDGVDLFFRGGHRHVITPDLAAELGAAGFSDYIGIETTR